MIGNIFKDLCSNIEIPHEDITKIYEYKKEITICIDQHFGNNLAEENSQFIGSFGRNTAIYPENIRLLTIIPEEMYWQLSLNIQKILGEVKKALVKKYSSCDYSDNGNGLNINMDGNISFEIVPGFMYNNGTYMYLCNGIWRKLNLKSERKNFSYINLKVNNNLIELCRILKLWKNARNVDISNILLDTLAYHFFYYHTKTYSYDLFDEMLVNFFKYLQPKCKRNSFVSLDGETVLKNKIDLSDEVFFSVTTAQTALTVAECGMMEEAIKDWQKILGSSMFSKVNFHDN